MTVDDLPSGVIHSAIASGEGASVTIVDSDGEAEAAMPAGVAFELDGGRCV